MNLTKLSITEFANETSADKAVPGGGCVAAVSATLGASLIEMVGHMTSRKALKQGVELDKGVAHALEAAKIEKEKMLNLVNKDAEAFDGCMQAFALPKNTDAEKAVRSEAIQQAYKNAILPPLEVCTTSVAMIKLAGVMVGKGDSNALSDSCVAVRTLAAAAYGGIYNVKINLGAIKDVDFVTDKMTIVKELEMEIENLTHSILSNVQF